DSNGTPDGPRKATKERAMTTTAATPMAQRHGTRNPVSSPMILRAARPPEVPDLLLGRGLSLVVIEPGVVEDFLSYQDAEGVSELQVLDEQVVLGFQVRPRHRGLEVEGQPLLDPGEARPPREIQEQRQVEHHGSRQDRVAAEEVQLDLHG